jgi:hypothetical protein
MRTTCDRCVAAATVSTNIPYVDSQGQARRCELNWCDHHYRAHEAALRDLLSTKVLEGV